MGLFRAPGSPAPFPPSLEDADDVDELLLSMDVVFLVRLGVINGFRTRVLIGSFSSLDCCRCSSAAVVFLSWEESRLEFATRSVVDLLLVASLIGGKST